MASPGGNDGRGRETRRTRRGGGGKRKSAAARTASAIGRKADALAREAREGAAAAEIDRSRGVFMISVAAELADMHPQTLRMYEARGLITPKRSPKNTRLYSHEDVDRLRRIQEMTVDAGLNLAGVETVLELEGELKRMRGELRRMRERAGEMEERMEREVERVRKSFRSELVPYGAYESKEVLPASRQESQKASGVRIPIERSRRRR